MPKALIFDVDGTLAETERDGHRVAFNRAFAEFSLDWYWDVDTYGELLLVSGGKERISHFMRAHNPPTPRFADNDAFIARLHACKTAHYLGIVRGNEMPARPGVLRLVEQARARGVHLAIATTTSPENVDALLGAWYGPQWPMIFPVLAAGDEVRRKKPDPEVYALALARLGLAADECVAIEDSSAGSAAADAAGVDVLVTRSEYFRDQEHAGALAVLDGLGESDAPARGHADGASFSGVVTLEQIDAWQRARRARSPSAAKMPDGARLPA